MLPLWIAVRGLIICFIFQQDQYDNVSQHTQKGLDFLERYGHFLRDRANIEVEYAGKLRYYFINYKFAL